MLGRSGAINFLLAIRSPISR